MASPTEAVGGPVRSTFADYPDFVAILPKYVEHLRVQQMHLECLRRQRDWPALETIAHQLKGSGGSYGFAELSARAAALETAAGAEDAARVSAALAAVMEHIDRILA